MLLPFRPKLGKVLFAYWDAQNFHCVYESFPRVLVPEWKPSHELACCCFELELTRISERHLLQGFLYPIVSTQLCCTFCETVLYLFLVRLWQFNCLRLFRNPCSLDPAGFIFNFNAIVALRVLFFCCRWVPGQYSNNIAALLVDYVNLQNLGTPVSRFVLFLRYHWVITQR